MSEKTSKHHRKKPSGILPKILILAGIAVLVAVVLVIKNQPSQTTPQPAQSAEAQLDEYLKEGKPTFIFFHSNNCQSCIDMMAVVDQVYPEFNQSVGLVDVNVYDPTNQNLLQRAKIYTIPTQVFVDASGQGKVAMGVMTVENFRQQLQKLAAGEL